MKSIGDVGVDDIKSDVAYVKGEEKQSQIVGPLAERTNDRTSLKLLTEIDVKLRDRSNIITGCIFLDNEKVLDITFNVIDTNITNRFHLNNVINSCSKYNSFTI
jgi:hypothetical protein